jgi:starvation-inducible DNA-binding protein
MSIPSLHATQIALPAKSRKAMVQVLNQHLADLLDLVSQLENAHWNVRGPHFFSLHKAFEEISGLIEGEIDALAERITTLGGVAEGSLRQAAEHSRLPEFPGKVQGLELAAALAVSVGQCANALRNDVAAAEKADDPGTADLLTGLSQVLDKSLWLLEAHTPTS